MQNTSAVEDVFDSDNDSWDSHVGDTDNYAHACGKLTCTGMACAGQLYINGAPVNTTLTTDVAGTLRDDSAYLVRMGSFNNSTNELDGRIAGHMEVFTPSVSDACVAERFAAGRP
jgi:hypothetical protein